MGDVEDGGDVEVGVFVGFDVFEDGDVDFGFCYGGGEFFGCVVVVVLLCGGDVCFDVVFC